MKGYDFGLLKEVEQFIKVPITLVGGADLMRILEMQ